MTLSTPERAKRIAALETELAELRKIPATQPTFIALPDRSYKVAETLTTVAQYAAYCTATDTSMPSQPGPASPNNPVCNVSYYDAQRYAEWLSEKTGHPCRLPTEDEFEHFCGNHTKGDESIAVYDKAAAVEVKTKEANNYGLYDVLGLAWEWQASPYE